MQRTMAALLLATVGASTAGAQEPSEVRPTAPGRTAPTPVTPGTPTLPNVQVSPGQATRGTTGTAADPGQARALAEPTGAFNDRLFAAAAASAGMAEVGSSRIAAERATSDEIKTFARKMIADHTQANRELMALATKKGLTLPTSISIGDQAAVAALSALSGEAFDDAYAQHQMAAHICAVGLFTAEAELGQDPEVKAWAAKTLPALKEHKMMIKRMCDSPDKKGEDRTSK